MDLNNNIHFPRPVYDDHRLDAQALSNFLSGLRDLAIGHFPGLNVMGEVVIAVPIALFFHFLPVVFQAVTGVLIVINNDVLPEFMLDEPDRHRIIDA